MNKLILAIVIASFVLVGCSSNESTYSPAKSSYTPTTYIPVEIVTPVERVAPTPTRQCCKYCSKGKACGDSCISRSYTCHKGPGCACNR